MKFIIIVSLFAAIQAKPSNFEATLFQPQFPMEQSTRIVGGEEAEKNSIPYQVALYIYAEEKRYFCGGSLISSKCILTAAHCIKAGVIEVILGAHNINIVEASQIRINATKFVVHEGYDSDEMVNDIALILLDEAVELNKNIATVQLPSLSESGDDFVGDVAKVSGWGRISDTETTITDRLRFVEAPVITNKNCNEEFFGVIKDTHICMEGINYKSACNGDSGGPLVYKGKLIGCVSFGIAFGCEVGWPSAFTRITSYLNWIAQNSDIVLQP